jgi:hypothetical protein
MSVLDRSPALRDRGSGPVCGKCIPLHDCRGSDIVFAARVRCGVKATRSMTVAARVVLAVWVRCGGR